MAGHRVLRPTHSCHINSISTELLLSLIHPAHCRQALQRQRCRREHAPAWVEVYSIVPKHVPPCCQLNGEIWRPRETGDRRKTEQLKEDLLIKGAWSIATTNSDRLAKHETVGSLQQLLFR